MARLDLRKTVSVSKRIMERYDLYTGHLKFPGDWGERVIRAWLVFEVFGGQLGWPIESIIFGERFDVLFVDKYVNPRIYLETKAPGELRHKRNLMRYEAKASKLAERFSSIEQVVISDVETWVRIDKLRKERLSAKLDDSSADWVGLLEKLQASRYR